MRNSSHERLQSRKFSASHFKRRKIKVSGQPTEWAEGLPVQRRPPGSRSPGACGPSAWPRSLCCTPGVECHTDGLVSGKQKKTHFFLFASCRIKLKTIQMWWWTLSRKKSVYVCVCERVGSVHVGVCAYMWEPGDQPGWHSPGLVHLLFLKTRSLIGSEPIKQAMLGGRRPLGIHVSPSLQPWESKQVSPHPAFLHMFWILNSGPWAFKATLNWLAYRLIPTNVFLTVQLSDHFWIAPIGGLFPSWREVVEKTSDVMQVLLFILHLICWGNGWLLNPGRWKGHHSLMQRKQGRAPAYYSV